VIRVHGLAKRFGDTRVLSGIDLDLADGLLLVTGPNGSSDFIMSSDILAVVSCQTPTTCS